MSLNVFVAIKYFITIHVIIAYIICACNMEADNLDINSIPNPVVNNSLNIINILFTTSNSSVP